MVKVSNEGVWIIKGRDILEYHTGNPDLGRKETIASKILLKHHTGTMAGALPEELNLKFDSLISHDITYVNIIQTAKASGLKEFPIPYTLTNCHNSLCAVGGTINADDHIFGLSAARRYGGIFVPPHLAVIHSYAREELAACGKMILGSDSHTRYGSLGCMGVGEGGGELVKQLLSQNYQLPWPKIIAVYLGGKLRKGSGPQDVALAIISSVFKEGIAKNAVLEFIGDGIGQLSSDFRAGIDVMTTETTCWSSIWETDEIIRQYYKEHNRENDFTKLAPGEEAYYDALIHVDLSSVKPMIALPFHPSNAYEISTLLSNAKDIFNQVEKDSGDLIENPDIKLKLMDKITKNGDILIDQAIVAGCAGGTFDNIMAVKSILENKKIKNSLWLSKGINFSIYPGSQPIMLELSRNGTLSDFLSLGAIVRTAFCGPCFGAGDVPANDGISIRHCTRNFPNREGSKPGQGQISSVCLMDARSIAATVLNGGSLASIESLDWEENALSYSYDPSPYQNKVYYGFGKADSSENLRYGPNISDWPPMEALRDNILLKIVSYIDDPVTTTDELIPSGETSSFRSNPMGLAEFTLSRKDPSYVGWSKKVKEAALLLNSPDALNELLPELPSVINKIGELNKNTNINFQLSSAIFARKPGDGSAREQAASCQRVLGGAANFAYEYATKRYRSNLINWGIIPFIVERETPFKKGDYIFIPGIKEAIKKKLTSITAWVITVNAEASSFNLTVPELNQAERDLILAGSLINLNAKSL